jgi:rRNA-processing protein FCF1
MAEVLMDTNFLLVPYQFKLDVFSELERLLDGPFTLVVPSCVVRELRGIAKRAGGTGAAARFALKLLESRGEKAKTVESGLAVDDWLFEYAKANRAVVCTSDSGLKRRLKAERLRVVGLRGKSKVGFV